MRCDFFGDARRTRPLGTRERDKVKNNIQNLVVVLLVGGVLGAGICFAVLKYREGNAGVSSRSAGRGNEANSEQDAEARNPEALGRIEPAGGVIDVSGPVGDRITGFAKGVKAGATVRAGEPLVFLESGELIQIELLAIELEIAQAKFAQAAQERAAEAAAKAAEIDLKKARLAEGDLALHQAKINVATAAQKTARKDFDVLSEILEEGKESNGGGFVNQQQVDQQATLLEKANAELAYAKAAHAKAKETVKVAILAAEAQLEAANKQLELAKAGTAVKLLEKKKEVKNAALERTTVRAPITGTILKVFAQAGEAVGPRPILKMADLTKMVVVAEVYETDIKLIRGKDDGKVAKRHVLITSKAFDLPEDGSKEGLKGIVESVESIGNLVSTPELKHLDPFARSDRHSVEVVVAIDDEDVRKAANLVNLQVIVKFSSQDDSDENAPGVAQSGS
jgi:HlyD family secretion protein